jgi:hypothetical protein
MGPLTILITVAIIVTLLLLLYALTPRSNNVTFGTTMGRDGMPLPPYDLPVGAGGESGRGVAGRSS